MKVSAVQEQEPGLSFVLALLYYVIVYECFACMHVVYVPCM